MGTGYEEVADSRTTAGGTDRLNQSKGAFAKARVHRTPMKIEDARYVRLPGKTSAN